MPLLVPVGQGAGRTPGPAGLLAKAAGKSLIAASGLPPVGMRLGAGAFPLTLKIAIPDEATPQIPKIIHQIQINLKLASEVNDSIEKLRSLNPGWEHRLYDDAAAVAFIEAHYGRAVLQRYLRINPAYGAAKADLFRYLVMYKSGGVYLDLKSSVTRPLDTVLRSDDEFILSHWNTELPEFRGWGQHHLLRHLPKGEFQQWFIVSRPGHPFLKAVIERVLRNIDHYIPDLQGSGSNGVHRTTGPIAYTLAIAPITSQHPHRLLDVISDLGFKYTIYPGVTHTLAHTEHYSRNTTPVVKVGLAILLMSQPLKVLRRLKAMVRG